MSMTSRKNLSVKSIQSVMASEKKHSEQALIEWEMACNTNVNRGTVYNQTEIHSLYARDDWRKCEQGASKTCHLHCHNGNEFQYIVVKRHQTNGWIDEHAENPNTKQTGNQLIDEINCWLEYEETDKADLLCPILKYFTSKSDKVTAISKKMQANVVIIAQKAVYVNSAAWACRKAEELNRENGFWGENADQRLEKLRSFSRSQGWRDAMNNPGNSGVVFDYSRNCYKAVFIDYAL